MDDDQLVASIITVLLVFMIANRQLERMLEVPVDDAGVMATVSAILDG